MIINGVDLNDFGRKVERLCEFLLIDKVRDGSDDIAAVLDIKDDATLLQNVKSISNIEGFDKYMRGL